MKHVYKQWLIILITLVLNLSVTDPIRAFDLYDDHRLFNIITSLGTEISNADIEITTDLVTWYDAFDECAIRQRIFLFPLSQKVIYLARYLLRNRTVWVEYYKSEYGWEGHSGAQSIIAFWTKEEDENAPEGKCATLTENGELQARDCLEYHPALCINPTVFYAFRRGMPPEVPTE
ncbi:hypothetical protein CRM22_000179 [Opisthorchis felineus]|uniref:C-type lectin domain-containing protein n=1 Tax=Opisthorchis felineus TaxID=147828 RepID=A0A4S2MGM6_OPIFE|nr:hypothetical protein CRM22_000179 [Opisthorchis felineus]